MDKKVRFMTKTNALVTLLLLLGIVVLVNVLSQWFYGRVDLTESRVFTLSESSEEAVKALEDLEVRVYISENLPDEVNLGYGRTVRLRGIDQKFLDKLEEYRSHSDGQMTLTRVQGDVESKAETAKLRLFSAEEAKVAAGRLEFTRYALGATFHYKNVTEVLPLAIQPEFYEFEITKILLRLKEKYEQSRLMVDVLETGQELFDAVTTCQDTIAAATKGDDDPGVLGLGAGAGSPKASQLVAALPDIQSSCGPVLDKLAAADATLANRNNNLDRVLDDARRYVEFYRQMLGSAQATEPERQNEAVQIAGLLGRLHDMIDEDHDLLVNSPGRKTIGILCGHEEFCPFSPEQPMFRPEIAQMLAQNNPMAQRFMQQASQVEQEIAQINESVREGLFTQRGFDVKRVKAGEPLPNDIDALVVYGPRKPLPDRDLYEIDQFLLSGRPVVVFINRFDVKVRNFNEEGEMALTSIGSTESNIQELLAAYGVDVRRDLVLEPRLNASLTLTELVRQGQLMWQSQRAFPYPMLPRFEDLNADAALVRGVASLALPYVSSLDTSKAEGAGLKVLWLARSSKDAITTTGDAPLVPPEQVEWAQAQTPSGPYVVAATVSGTFESYFKGKDEPAKGGEEAGDGLPERKRLDSGEGRLLVVGSNLGLENLSTERIFEGFNMAQLAGGGFDFMEKSKTYWASYQNWRLRIQQITEVLEDSIPFLQNVFDWAVQNEALLSIRAKGFVRRPLAQLSDGQESALRYAGLLAAPVLFILFGLIRWQVRRRRRPTL